MSNSLEHYGILGMKWGVRRTPEQLGHKKRSELKTYKAKQRKKLESQYGSQLKRVNKGLKKYPKNAIMQLEKKTT